VDPNICVLGARMGHPGYPVYVHIRPPSIYEYWVLWQVIANGYEYAEDQRSGSQDPRRWDDAMKHKI
jgi:hypothetical protein